MARDGPSRVGATRGRLSMWRKPDPSPANALGALPVSLSKFLWQDCHLLVGLDMATVGSTMPAELVGRVSRHRRC